jgi:hypothetical protein
MPPVILRVFFRADDTYKSFPIKQETTVADVLSAIQAKSASLRVLFPVGAGVRPVMLVTESVTKKKKVLGEDVLLHPLIQSTLSSSPIKVYCELAPGAERKLSSALLRRASAAPEVSMCSKCTNAAQGSSAFAMQEMLSPRVSTNECRGCALRRAALSKPVPMLPTKKTPISQYGVLPQQAPEGDAVNEFGMARDGAEGETVPEATPQAEMLAPVPGGQYGALPRRPTADTSTSEYATAPITPRPTGDDADAVDKEMDDVLLAHGTGDAIDFDAILARLVAESTELRNADALLRDSVDSVVSGA